MVDSLLLLRMISFLLRSPVLLVAVGSGHLTTPDIADYGNWERMKTESSSNATFWMFSCSYKEEVTLFFNYLSESIKISLYTHQWYFGIILSTCNHICALSGDVKHTPIQELSMSPLSEGHVSQSEDWRKAEKAQQRQQRHHTRGSLMCGLTMESSGFLVSHWNIKN